MTEQWQRPPDLTAGAHSRDLLVQLVQSVGRSEGSIATMSSQMAEISRALTDHIADEAGLSDRLDVLISESQRRHNRIHARLDVLEKASVKDGARRAVWLSVGGAAIGVAGWAIGVAATIGYRQIADHIGKAIGL